VAGLVLMSGIWKPGITFNVFGTDVGLQQLVRDGALHRPHAAVAGHHASSRCARPTSSPGRRCRRWPSSSSASSSPWCRCWPCSRPARPGAFAAVARAVTGADGQPIPWAYFWFTGALSSFLDNAPTYLVFFNLAGGDPQVLMTTLAPTLAAISAGAVFMGANTYIGNAPNFMVKAIAEDRGIRMPSFFGYMAWSGAILIPLFVVMTFIWFR
jgi:hypothetical protein